MRKININAAFEAMTGYAVERQNGVERHQPAGRPPWPEERRRWIKDILKGMSEMNGTGSAGELADQFDLRLAQARECFAVELTPVHIQKEMVRSLQIYVSALERKGYDTRPELWDVKELMEDMVSHLPWDARAIGADAVRDQTERALVRMTAQQPIRFTRILLGGERGPCESAYVSGAVTNEADVMGTDLYEEMAGRYPEVESWPAVCVVYTCGGQRYCRDASDWDLSLMRMAGDRFLDQPEVRRASGPYEMTLSVCPAMTTQNAERVMTWQTLR